MEQQQLLDALSDWLTIDPPRRKTVTALRRQILALLRELPEDMTVADLRDALEEV
jgi:DNA-binding transcriptional ArsR family regulator